MWRAGRYGVPFPYPPYALQEHAVTALREFLDACNASSDDTDAAATQPKIAVLESPTGTGKSQILLNAVLSHLYEVVDEASDGDAVGAEDTGDTRSRSSPPLSARRLQGEQQQQQPPEEAATLTFDQALRQRRDEDAVYTAQQQLRKHTRARRRRPQPRSSRFCGRTTRTLNRDSDGMGSDALLIEQNDDDKQEDVDYLASYSRSSSGSSSSGSSASGSYCSGHRSNGDDDDDKDDGDADEDADVVRVEAALATQVPLRQPKVYYASRTHTQLQQLFSDWQRTAFAKQRVRARGVVDSGGCHSTESGQQQQQQQHTTRTTFSSPPRRLRAVHVAGRQQLCINHRIRQRAARCSGDDAGDGGGGGAAAASSLNQLCAEAMRYEYSATGRAARRTAAQRHASGVYTASVRGMPGVATAAAPLVSPQHVGASVPVHGVSQVRGVDGDVDVVCARGGDMVGDVEDVGISSSISSNCRPGRHRRNSSNRSHVPTTTAVVGEEERNDNDGDEEEAATVDDVPAGCAYCVETQLRKLLRHVMRHRSTSHDTLTSHTSAATSQPATPRVSVSLQEILRLGQELKACPYLATRLLVRGADVVFIPYSYLVDEEQRYTLLGGAATNAMLQREVRTGALTTPAPSDGSTLRQADATAAAAAGAAGAVAAGVRPVVTNSRLRSVHDVSLTTLLRHQPEQWQSRRVTPGGRAFARSLVGRTDRDCKTPTRGIHTGGGAGDDDGTQPTCTLTTTTTTTARCSTLPPNFTRSLVVIDEAHNLVDFCRANSSADVRTRQLQVTRLLVQCYAACYEAQLLSVNKQRLRELCMLCDKLLSFMSSPGRGTESEPQQAARTLPFHAWLFDADVAYVDVYVLLSFLASTRLCCKLCGLVSAAYAAPITPPRTTTETRTRRTRYTAAAQTTTTTAPRDVAFGDVRRQLDALLFSQPLVRPASTAANDSAARASRHARGRQQRAVAFTTSALRSFVHFLRWFYYSDATTRVLCAPYSRLHGGADTGTHDRVLRLVQLEPGKHTVYELLRHARAAVLAGGTMQPLALTCAPLLPCPSQLRNGDAVISAAALLPDVRLIVEGHVVPPSSVAVWALPCGPGGACMQFSYTAMAAQSTHRAAQSLSSSSSTFVATTLTSPSPSRNCARGASNDGVSDDAATAAAAAAATWHELALTLLNVARVAPPASGVVVFFTSHDMVARALAYLRTSGYYETIDGVKRIFHEHVDGSTAAVTVATAHTADAACTSNASHLQTLPSASIVRTSAATVQATLDAYRAWLQSQRSSSSSSSTGDDDSNVNCNAQHASRGCGGSDNMNDDGAGCSRGRYSSCRRGSVDSCGLSPRGAMLLAVMGGRLAEGVNFADDMARVVVVVGVPFANPDDVELQLHLHHIATRATVAVAAKDTASGAGLAHGAAATTPATCAGTMAAMSDDVWQLYTDLCMRSVNQCIGRCIRHAGDYAVVLLADVRYARRAELRGRVSQWLQPSLRVASSFGECFRGMRQFFAAHAVDTHRRGANGNAS